MKCLHILSSHLRMRPISKTRKARTFRSQKDGVWLINGFFGFSSVLLNSTPLQIFVLRISFSRERNTLLRQDDVPGKDNEPWGQTALSPLFLVTWDQIPLPLWDFISLMHSLGPLSFSLSKSLKDSMNPVIACKWHTPTPAAFCLPRYLFSKSTALGTPAPPDGTETLPHS